MTTNQDELEGKVDVFTHSKELAEAFLTEYPDVIFPEQYKIDDTDKEDLYCFFDLREIDAIKFLGKHKGKYEMRDSRTRRFLHISAR